MCRLVVSTIRITVQVTSTQSQRLSSVLHVTPNEDVLGGEYAPLSRHIEPLARWEASRQTGREPQHLGQSRFP